jgi:hypothetical protein
MPIKVKSYLVLNNRYKITMSQDILFKKVMKFKSLFNKENLDRQLFRLKELA